MQSRRDFGRLLFAAAAAGALTPAAAMAAASKLNYTWGGVDLGVCLYNFRDMPRPADQSAYIDQMINACLQAGTGLVEINSNYTEPAAELPFQGIPRIQDTQPNVNPANPPKWSTFTPAELAAERDRIRQWRLSQPTSYFKDIGDRFRAAGLTPFSYVITFTWDMTDPEIDAIFKHAQALGVNVFSTNQTKVELGPRLKPFAERYNMDMGFHNHSQVDNPNEVASVASFEKLFALSPRFKANLDVGHFVAGNNDPVAFMIKHPDRITHLHMKDRKRDNGANLPWGQGDTPLVEILLLDQLLKNQIPAVVEYEYRGEGTGVQETRKCLDFMRAVLT